VFRHHLAHWQNHLTYAAPFHRARASAPASAKYGNHKVLAVFRPDYSAILVCGCIHDVGAKPEPVGLCPPPEGSAQPARVAQGLASLEFCAPAGLPPPTVGICLGRKPVRKGPLGPFHGSLHET